MAQSIGIISKPFVSAVSMLDKPDIRRQIIDASRDDEFLDFLTDTNRGRLFTPSKEKTESPIYYTWLDDALFEIIDTTGVTVADSGTSEVTITNAGSIAPKLMNNMLLRFPDGKVGLVHTVTGTGFKIKSVSGSNLTLTAGMKLSAFSDAQESGSDGPDPVRWGITSVSNRIQAFRTAIEITDIQNMSGVEFEINGENRFLPYEMIKGLQYHKAKISLAFWLGEVSTTAFSDTNPALVGSNSRGIQTTRGMDQYITTYGVADTVATPGSYVIGDLRDFVAQLTAKRAPKEYWEVGSHAAVSLKSDFLKNLGSSGVTSGRMVVNDRKLDFEVETYRYGGYTFHLRAINVLSNENVVNYIGTGSNKIDVARSLYYLPLGKTPVYGNGMVDYFCYRYMTSSIGGNTPNRTTDGFITEVMTGALAPIPTDRRNVLTVDWTSHAGLDVSNPKVFGRSIVTT